MESLNMAKLNLSSVRNNAAAEVAPPKQDVTDTKLENNSFTDPEEEYHCEYREDIWKTLLEQDADKPNIHLQSPQLEFRGALVQQLRDVTKKLSLTLATLHSAVAMLDLFMDAHRLRADRLTHVALACLSLAAKSEENFSKAPTLKTLSKVSGVQLCGKTFRQLEWMVGQHVRWRLLSPTPVTFASLLAQYVVADCDLTTRHPKFVRRFKRDGAKLLEAYLDLTLSDVRLKVVECVDVGCACVACARAELGLSAWPAWLAAIAGRDRTTVAPIARLLQRMMQILKTRENPDLETDQGYSSAKTSPNVTPCTSPNHQISPSSSTSSHKSIIDTYRQHPIDNRRTDMPTTCVEQHRNSTYIQQDISSAFLDVTDTNLPNIPNQEYLNANLYRIPVDMSQRVNHPADYRFCRSSRLLESGYDSIQPSTSVAVKRGLDSTVELDRKRYRLTSHLSQVVL
ncbi:cyclin-J-like [Maniola hyperantus]|uniref:cyclin-J-like n=1 Tax=Aphantopus hyperantus TaxID=2795564 RepID=UPI001567CF3D|nr:cyclin-J-like [Maniola hyperantus]